MLVAFLFAAALQGEDAWSRIAPLFDPPAELRDDLGGYRPVLAFKDGRPVRSPDDWRARRAEILKEWTELLGPWPPLLENPSVDLEYEEKLDGFTRSRIEIETAPGRKASAYLLVPEGKGPFPAILDVFYFPDDGAGIRESRRGQNDFGYTMVKRGFVALCLGQNPTTPRPNADLYYPTWDKAQLQPLSHLAYVAANAHTVLARRPDVDPARIGVVGHSYGGKWALFAGALYEKFAATAVSDPGIVFDEKLSNVNYWEPWYLGYQQGETQRPRGTVTPERPRTGVYKTLVERGMDLHELHVLMCPRPFFTAGGAVDPPARWKALNHSVAVNRLLGVERVVGMSNRKEHKISPEASEQIASFFVHFLGRKK